MMMGGAQIIAVAVCLVAVVAHASNISDPTVTGACSADDQTSINKVPQTSGSDGFGAKNSDCGHQCYSIWSGMDTNCFKSCLKGKVPMSDGCAGCFAAAGKYGSDNCKLKCMFSWCSSGCLSCTNNYLGKLDSCTGYTAPRLSPCNSGTELPAGEVPMVYFPQIAQRVPDLPKLPNADGSNSYLGDIVYSHVPGKEMAAGFYHDLAGPTLHYTYTYEEFKYIVAGEFHITDGTGQKVVAKAGDLMYFPCGTNVSFSTPDSALGYFVGQRGAIAPAEATVRAAIESNPKMVHYPQIAERDINKLPHLNNTDGSFSYLGDIVGTRVPEKEMTAGFYHDLAGPTLHYTYTYEEFKYIVAGEFHLVDGTGQKVVAKEGDLVYFPKGSKISFSTPNSALGYFVGQRKIEAPILSAGVVEDEFLV